MAAPENPHVSPVSGLYGRLDRPNCRVARVNVITGGPRSCTFRTGQRSGVWFVTKNDAFYGDYLSRSQAIEAACFGARSVEAKGGSARVVSMPGESPIAHQLAAANPRTAGGRR